uniref:Cysteine-sulphoxide lyase n=1 Tax=Allium cepa TaxID=4679 RepID=Q9M7L9_ALLCE|nr:cysteine-sulphoxide lyase [Allium cepa]
MDSDKSVMSRNKLWLITFLFLTSLVVNLYFYYDNSFALSSPFLRLTWTTKAATEAEKVAAIYCSDHGRAYLDGIPVNGVPICECHNCYSGPTCSVLASNCTADATTGDAMFLEKYWLHHRVNTAMLESGWHRMSYFIGHNFMSDELDRHIRLLHNAVGNAKVDDKFLVFGNGVTQLLNGVIISLSPNVTATPTAPIKKVVAYVPYYPVFKSQTSFFNFKGYEWKGNASDYVNTTNPQDFIELVTSPNNPDGLLRKSIIPGSLAVYDHATYWPHYAPIKYASDEDIMLFALSKYTGHSGSRFGWAFVRDKSVYDKLTTYISTNSEGVSRESQLRTLFIIKEILLQIKLNRGTIGDFNWYGHHTLRARWVQLNRLVAQSTRFSLQEISAEYCNYFQRIRNPSPTYGWLKCEWEEDTDCAAVLSNGKILTQSGVLFEASSRYARLSIIKTQDDFNQLMERLSVLVMAKRSTSGYNYDIINQERSKRPFIYGGDEGSYEST